MSVLIIRIQSNLNMFEQYIDQIQHLILITLIGNQITILQGNHI